jgi:hypothetical protein
VSTEAATTLEVAMGVTVGKYHLFKRNRKEGKFPSSEMIHKLAKALGIDRTELFYKKIDPVTAMKDSQKAAVEDLGGSAVRLIKGFFTEHIIPMAHAGKE